MALTNTEGTDHANWKYALVSQANHAKATETSGVISPTFTTFDSTTARGFAATSTAAEELLIDDAHLTAGDQYYYLIVYLANTNSSQNGGGDGTNSTDERGTYNGTLTLSAGGGQVKACFSPNGECTNQAPTTYSGTIYRYSETGVQLGHRIVVYPIQAWCANSTEFGNSCDFGWSWETEAECEAYVTEQSMENTTCEQGTVQPISYETDPANLNKTFYLKHTIESDTVTESYVGFVVTSTMASANPVMTAGTYYLRGLDTYDENGDCKNQYYDSNTGGCVSPYYESNKTVLQSAFGTNTNYCTDYSSIFECRVSGLGARVNLEGNVRADGGDRARCSVGNFGDSSCDV